MTQAASAEPSKDAATGRGVLIVDLDRTLLCSDTLVEGIVAGLFQKPFSLAGQLAMAPFSRPAFKAWVFDNVVVDYEAIPENGPLVDYLKTQKEAGRSIHLVSAAHQGVVDVVAQRFDFFDSAIGTSGDVNLKGKRKLDHILESFGPDFVYAGDSSADIKVWEGAQGAVFAGTSAEISRRLAGSSTELEADFSRQSGGLRSLLKSLRLHQWAKNALLFLPLLLSHQYADPQAILSTFLAFLLMGVTASGTYVLNDLADLGSDRRHHSKRRRPLAAGSASLELGLILALLLVGAGLVGAFVLSPAFAAVLSLYVAITLAYSMYLKRVPILDVFVLASLFTLRLVMGTIVIGAAFSLWLMTFSMFFFLSLALAKRHVELTGANTTPGMVVRGRGYYPEDAPLTLVLGAATGTASILVVVLYLVDEAYAAATYSAPAFLSAIPFVVGMWTARIWLLAHRGHLNDDPVSFAVKDPKSIAMGAFLALAVGAALIAPQPAIFG